MVATTKLGGVVRSMESWTRVRNGELLESNREVCEINRKFKDEFVFEVYFGVLKFIF